MIELLELENRIVPSNLPLIQTMMDYTELLHRTPAINEVNDWLYYRDHGVSAREQVGLFLSSPEYFSQTNNDHDWLTSVYNHVLGRNPESDIWLQYGLNHQAIAIGISESIEATLRSLIIDPEVLNNGDIITASGNPDLIQPLHYDGTTGIVPQINLDNTVTYITVQNIDMQPQDLTVVQLLPADGRDPITIPLPTTAIGTGLNPILGYNSDSNTVYLVVNGFSSMLGGDSGLQVFTSIDNGHSFDYKSTIGNWLAGTPLKPLTIDFSNNQITVKYHSDYNIITWTSADPTPVVLKGDWLVTSLDKGSTWDGNGIQL